MPINYSYLNGRPNATYRDEIINNPGLLTQRQQSEAYRLARQSSPNFGYQGTNSSQQQLLGASRPLGEPPMQVPGQSSAFGTDWGGMGKEGSGNTQSGRLQSLFGYDPNMATITGAVGGAAGVPFSGLLGNALFGNHNSIVNSGINAGLGTIASQLGKNGPGLLGIAGAGMKAASGKELGLTDLLGIIAGFNPAVRTGMGVYALGKALYGLTNKKDQATAEEEMNAYTDQAQFDSMPSVENSPYPSQQPTESMPMPTTENTFDMMDSPFASFSDFAGYGADGGGWDGAADPGKVGFQ
jgi:hypothetical protein